MTTLSSNNIKTAVTFSDWAESKFKLPVTDLVDFSEKEIANPETAARVLREQWQLGELSIKNMVHLLESKGVKIFWVNEKNIDAFSFWKENTAFIFLNSKKTGERCRFDAAHELGHLVLHKHGGGVNKDADRFASAFLMPNAGVEENATSPPFKLKAVR